MYRILNTDRLILREMTECDIDFILTLEAQGESIEWVGIIQPEDIKPSDIINKCHWFIQRTEALPTGGAIKFIVYKDDLRIGEVHLTCNWETTSEWEIGYHFLREHWGKGYATEAVIGVIQYAFRELRIHKLMAFINCENKRSVKLAERLGMVLEGHMREARLVGGQWNDEFVFALLKGDLI